MISQIIKNLVRKITYEKILNCEKELIQGFMKGIIAGEGCIEMSKKDKKYRVHISVTKSEEKEINYQCLKLLNIESKKYKGDKLIIFKRKNNIQLLKQRLVTLSEEKYNKFLKMMQSYQNIKFHKRKYKE